MNFNRATMVTQSLIIHEQNRPNSQFKVNLLSDFLKFDDKLTDLVHGWIG